VFAFAVELKSSTRTLTVVNDILVPLRADDDFSPYRDVIVDSSKGLKLSMCLRKVKALNRDKLGGTLLDVPD